MVTLRENRIDKYRMYVDGELRHEATGPFRAAVGDINDDGSFAYTQRGNAFIVDTNGSAQQVIDCCDIIFRYNSFDSIVAPPRIDGEGRGYFFGSTDEQIPDRFGFYSGAASIYTGPNPETDFVFQEIGVDSDASPVFFAYESYDVNEHGDVTVGGYLIPRGEQVSDGIASLGRHTQTSINNHQDFTLINEVRDEQNRIVPAVTVYLRDEVHPRIFHATFGNDVRQAFINDQRKVAFLEEEAFGGLSKHLGLIDIETGERTELIGNEDTAFLEFYQLYDYNDAGQLLVDIRGVKYLAVPTSDPIADLDFDGLTTASDIDRLASGIREGSTRDFFDLTQDGTVTSEDLSFWVDELVGTTIGDTDLDFDVDFADFLNLSTSFGQSNGWSGGDFDGSGKTEFVDFLSLSNEFGTLVPTLSVPEPRFTLRTLALFLIVISRWIGRIRFLSRIP